MTKIKDDKPKVLIVGGALDTVGSSASILAAVHETFKDLAQIVTLDDPEVQEGLKIESELNSWSPEQFKQEFYLPHINSKPKHHPWKHNCGFKRDRPWVPTPKPLNFK